MGGTAVDQGSVTSPGGGMVGAVRVASKPAFAVVVGAIAFLAQDILQRVTGVHITVDEGIAGFALVSYLAYWLVPASLQDNGATVIAGTPPASPTV
jgi:uncharacterized membrane protein